MSRLNAVGRYLFEHVFPLIALALILVYIFGLLIRAPYIGFSFNLSSGVIEDLYVPESYGLRTGDRLLQVGNITFDQYRDSLRQPLFENDPRDRPVLIRVQRGEGEVLVPWALSEAPFAETLDRVLNIWILALIFLIFGGLTYILARPKDVRWRALIAFNFLTALWLVASNVAQYRLWDSAVVMRMVTWVCVPVYIQLHWIFPRPLGTLHPIIKWVAYPVAYGLAIMQWLERLPPDSYAGAFVLSALVSLCLLVAHDIARPEHRRDIGLMLTGASIALVPAALLSMGTLFNLDVPPLLVGGLLSLPIMPGTYLYVIYRRQMGGLEMRANQAIAFYLYLTLLVAAVVLLILGASTIFIDQGALATSAIAVALFVGMTSALIYPRFRRLVDKYVLGISVPQAQLVERYTARITTSLELEKLIEILRDEVMHSLLIRQVALLRLDQEGKASPIFTLGVADAQLPKAEDIPVLLAQAGNVRSPRESGGEPFPCPWTRLALALSVEEHTTGLCLFGRRDPDDHYSVSEIPTLQLLMNQTALAMQNIEQAERLRALYMTDIERQESERKHLALDLHDDVLGQLAVLAMTVDEQQASEKFSEVYLSTVQHVREIISGLRPGMLNYGLHAAIEELADEVVVQIESQGLVGPGIRVDISPSQVRYTPEVELHLYRIVQQSVQNTLQHAKAHTICIQGRIEPGQVQLVVEDDGVGFASHANLDLSWLLANKHFGLAGMHERAALIGAELQIDSAAGAGTRVRVSWREKNYDSPASP